MFLLLLWLMPPGTMLEVLPTIAGQGLRKGSDIEGEGDD
jgi:hypothetical protein